MPTEEIPVKVEGAQIHLMIDTEMVNKTIAAAILSSGIGDRVKHYAEEFLTTEATGYGEKGLKKAVCEQMEKLVIELCQEGEIREQMKVAIRDALSEGLIQSVVKASLEATLKKLQRSY